MVTISAKLGLLSARFVISLATHHTFVHDNVTSPCNILDNNEILIEGFNVYRNDRNRLGGGVLLYVKTILSSNIVLSLMNDEVESVLVELPRLYKDRNGLTVGSIIPPNSSSSYYVSSTQSP